MARPLKVNEKFTTEMLTIGNVALDGDKLKFDLLNNAGDTVGDGVARQSKSAPGSITLVMSRYTPSIRVPINWLDALK